MWVGGVAVSQTRSKPLKTPKSPPKIAFFDPNFTFGFPKSHKNPEVGGCHWVGKQIWERFPKKKRFFLQLPLSIVWSFILPTRVLWKLHIHSYELSLRFRKGALVFSCYGPNVSLKCCEGIKTNKPVSAKHLSIFKRSLDNQPTKYSGFQGQLGFNHFDPAFNISESPILDAVVPL